MCVPMRVIGLYYVTETISNPSFFTRKLSFTCNKPITSYQLLITNYSQDESYNFDNELIYRSGTSPFVAV